MLPPLSPVRPPVFHVLVASLKLPVIGIYDPFPAENDFFQTNITIR